MIRIFLSLIIVCTSLSSIAQCSAGEVEVQIEIQTDAYGYEGYWELILADSACGEGTILSGGNTAVGCDGANLQNQPAGGYNNFQLYTSNPACLAQGTEYRIAYIDDWGDGGFEYNVLINGYSIENFTGTGGQHSFHFIADEPPAYDLTLDNVPLLAYQQQGSINIVAEISNSGTETINDLAMHYSIDNGTPVSQVVSSLSIANAEKVTIAHPTPWVPSVDGTYDIKVWYDNLNGSNSDANPDDDEMETTVIIGPGIPNVVDSYLLTLPVVVQIAGQAQSVATPTDLDFHPNLSMKQLWVLNKNTAATGSSTVTITNAGESSQQSVWKRDGNAWHFMSISTGIAFSENGNFGTSPGIYDANHNGGAAFTGPSLWSSDLSVYAEPSGGNGSHLDMLHESPQCQGIAHDSANRFWVFDGYNGDIVMYDFHEDHGPGNDDHSDGQVLRYSDVSVDMDSDQKVVSHLVLDKATDWLYVVDNDNQRVFRMDINSGTLGGTPNYGPYEALAQYAHVTNYDWEIVADSGLVEPAGIDVIDDRLLVSDYATGEIIIYDISAMPAIELKRVQTNAEGIMGIKLGPEGKIWFVDYDGHAVNRIDWVPDSTVGYSDIPSDLNYQVYPNPSNGQVFVQNGESSLAYYSVYNSLGQSVADGSMRPGMNDLRLDLPRGWYVIRMVDAKSGFSHEEALILR